ncbi:MAG TPA: ELWxxDGT repeat protein, partial [Chitinophagaceae bacterium]|nr:ELWxxDGT repeat protein [Chitinophagaceae bacterium]
LYNFNGTLFFTGDDGVHGSELWKSDGTTAGTVMVQDMNPGPNGFSSGILGSMNNAMYLIGFDNIHGSELWKCDGTGAGITFIKDINPGINSSNINNAFFDNGVFYFSAVDPVNGVELWKSDGTAAGTVMVKDLVPGSNSSFPSEITKMGNTIYFIARDQSNNLALWKTDGTAAGTMLIKTIAAISFFNYPFELRAYNNLLIFHTADIVNGFKIWKSDGTTAGTDVIKTIYNSNASANFRCNFSIVNGTCCFQVMDQEHGMELWTTDGTTAGTQLMKDIWPGPGSGLVGDFNSPSLFSIINDKLYFSANDGIHGEELWESDGTATGTNMLIEIVPGTGGSFPGKSIVGTNELLFLQASTDSTNQELFVVNTNSPGITGFLEFNGHFQNNDVLLDWKTINEHNLADFVVQRSIDGTHFTDIGTVAPSNTAGIHPYNFTDPGVIALNVSPIYYRLKLVHMSGPDIYSSKVTIDISLPLTLVLRPNPAHDNMQVFITAARAGTAWVKILDNAGREIKREYYSVSMGTNVFNMEISLLSPGKYYLQLIGITGDLLKTTQSFIKF